MARKKNALIGFLILIVSTLVVFLSLKSRGFFEDPAVALRELKGRGIEASPAQVRRAAKEGNLVLVEILRRAKVDFTEGDVDGRTALHHAITNNHLALFPSLKKGGAEVNQLDHAGHSPLRDALAKPRDEMARWLVKEGAEIDFKDGEVPAVISYYDSERWSDLAFLVDQGAEVSVIDLKGESLIGRAVVAKDPFWLKRFLSADASADDSFVDGERLVSRALLLGEKDLVIPLLQDGADPDSETPNGERLIHRVCRDWRMFDLSEPEAREILRQLISSGADLEKPDRHGLRTIQSVLKHEFVGGHQLLIPKTDDLSGTLDLAVSRKGWGALTALLKAGANVDEIVNGEPLIFTMIAQGEQEMVKELIDHGANLESLGKEGQRPLVTAIVAGQTDVVMTMLECERLPALDAHMEFPMTLEFRDLFGRKGLFDWYCRNEREMQPIMAATMLGQMEIVKRLLELGVNRFAKSKNGVFPIQMAAAIKNVPMQQLLIGVPYEDDQQERSFIVDLSEQKVYFYRNGKVVAMTRCSSGKSGYRTKTGNYVITDKTKNKVSNLYRDAKMPYFQRFSCGDIGFHEGNTYSRFASHGCIRLPMKKAKYFYSQTRIGDRVTIRK